MKDNNSDIKRRQFLKSSAVAVSSFIVVGLGANQMRKALKAGPDNIHLLRPPSAVDEDTFIAGCIKCGLCVQICPINAVKLAGIEEGLAYGTPYIDVREQACDFSCDPMQCVETCPTAVLDFQVLKRAGEDAYAELEKTGKLNDPNFNPFKVQIAAMKESVHMGFAKLNEKTCLGIQGKPFKGIPRGEDFRGVNRTPDGKAQRATPLADKHFDVPVCNLCVTECPIGEKAIVFENNKPVVKDGCTGCGVCVMVCPTETPSIIVEPVNA